MKAVWIALASVLLAGCAVVPVGGYPYAAVPEPGVSVGVAVPVYRPRPYYHYHPRYYGHRQYGPRGHQYYWHQY